MEPDIAATCEEILCELCDAPEAEGFLEPVNWKRLRLPDYPKLITRPMDLRTMKRKLRDECYESLGDFFSDLGLIWKNCEIYNHENSDIYRQCKVMMALADSLREKCFPLVASTNTNDADTVSRVLPSYRSLATVDTPKSVPRLNECNSNPSTDEDVALRNRTRLAYRLTLLTSDQLGQVVRLLESIESSALVKSAGLHDVSVKLLLDRLDRRSQKYVDCLVKSLVHQQQY